MTAIQARLWFHTDEKLAATGVGAGVGDTDSAEFVVGENEVLVLEAAVQRAVPVGVGVLWRRSAFFAVDAMTALVVYVTSLDDKAGDHPMEERMRPLVGGG